MRLACWELRLEFQFLIYKIIWNNRQEPQTTWDVIVYLIFTPYDAISVKGLQGFQNFKFQTTTTPKVKTGDELGSLFTPWNHDHAGTLDQAGGIGTLNQAGGIGEKN